MNDNCVFFVATYNTNTKFSHRILKHNSKALDNIDAIVTVFLGTLKNLLTFRGTFPEHLGRSVFKVSHLNGPSGNNNGTRGGSASNSARR